MKGQNDGGKRSVVSAESGKRQSVSLRKIWPWLAATLSGVLLALGYAPWEIEAVAWFWMAPLLSALWFSRTRSDNELSGRRRAAYGFGLGYVSGAVFFLINLNWLHTVTPPGAVALALFLAIYVAFFGAFAATIGRPHRHHLVALGDGEKRGSLMASSLHNIRFAFFNAAAWTGLEWLRGIVFTGFGWNGLGVALHENLLLIQIADIVGVTGLAFLLMFCGSIAVGTIRRIHLEFGHHAVRPHLDFAVAVLSVIGVFFYGLNRTTDKTLYEDTVPLRVLLVQLNIPIEEKWDSKLVGQHYRDYDEFTSLFTETGDVDLVIWPETALYFQFFHRETQAFLNHMLAKDDFHLMMGIEEGDLPDDFYNAVALMRNDTASVQLHRKSHLVPFGEYIPLRETFPPFEWFAGRQVPSDFSRGDSFEPLVMEEPALQLVPLVCFEDTLGRLVRKFVRPEAQLLVNVTNDAWFLDSPGARQHLANARFRCVELKRPMARAANTGVSGFIDHVGSLHDRTLAIPPDADPADHERIIRDETTGSHFVRGCRTESLEVPRHPPTTFYARFGDVFSIGMLVVTLGVVGVSLWRGRARLES